MKKHVILFTVACLLGWISIGFAQQDSTNLNLKWLESDQSPFVREQNYPQIEIELSPTNQAGVPVSGLLDANIALVDGSTQLEDVKIAPIVDVDQPLSLLLVLDVSGPMQGVLPEVNTAVSTLYQTLDQQDESAIITFASYADGTTVDVNNLENLDLRREWGFTNDEGALKNLVNAQRIDPSSGTPLYDALYKGIRLAASQSTKDRRAVILLTNGGDTPGSSGANGSLIANEAIVIDEARNLNIPVFTIGIGNQIDAAFLQRVAILTGGTFNPIPNPSLPKDALADVVFQMKQAYRVTATAVTPPDNDLHPLSITVSSNAGITTETIEFQALYPPIPQFTDVQLRLTNSEWFPMDSVRAVNGIVTIEPEIVSRFPLAEVNYFVGNNKLYTATNPPWSFEWETENLSSDQPYLIRIEAIDENAQPSIPYQKQLTIIPCNLFCQLGFSSTISPALLIVVLLLVLVILVVLLVARSRGEAPALSADEAAVSPSQPTFSEQQIPAPQQRLEGPLFHSIPPAVSDLPMGDAPPTPVLRNDETNETFTLDFDLRIGRDPGTNIQLKSDTVADHHAIIKREKGVFVLVVNAKHNMHTSINEEQIDDRKVLKDGDIIQIGNHRLQFIFQT